MREYAITDNNLYRGLNQDRFLWVEQDDGSTTLALADGVSSDRESYKVAEAATEAFIEACGDSGGDPFTSQRLIAIEHRVRAVNVRGATTVDVVHVTDSLIHICHAGDGRVYLLKDGYWRQVTEDHNLPDDKRVLTNFLTTSSYTPFWDIKILPRKRYRAILLATDGLYVGLADDLVLSTSIDQKYMEGVLRRARSLGSMDDATGIVAIL